MGVRTGLSPALDEPDTELPFGISAELWCLAYLGRVPSTRLMPFCPSNSQCKTLFTPGCLCKPHSSDLLQKEPRSPSCGAEQDCVCSALSLHFTCSSSRLSHIQFFLLLLPFPSSYQSHILHLPFLNFIFGRLGPLLLILHRPTLPYRTLLHWGFHLLWVISPPPPTSILRLSIYIVFVIHRITASPPRHPLLFSICSSYSFNGTLRAKTSLDADLHTRLLHHLDP